MNKQNLIDGWIKEAQLDKFSKHEKCTACGYPHSPFILCGTGAVFGSAIFGGVQYAVDIGNMDYFVHLRSTIARGHHWKNDIYFYIENGEIVIRFITDFNYCPAIKEIKIPFIEWKTIIEQLKFMRSNDANR